MAVMFDAASWRERPGMEPVLAALGADAGLTRFVGGAVRDALLALPVNDVDLATRLEPAEVVERLAAAGIKPVPTGIEHGTITAVSDGHPFEVTTLRRDVSTDGRRATVAFTGDWKADAARRDFTINALSADPVTGEIFDYFGGLDDLAQRRVRFIGDPLQRIAEDHLRILRFFRFYARFGTGEPDAAALDACTARANDLMALSRERIADELLKLLARGRSGSDGRDHAPARHPHARIAGDRARAGARARTAGRCRARCAGLADPLRRLAALLPRDPAIADAVGGQAQAVEQGAQAAGLRRRNRPCPIAADARLPRRQSMRHRPPAAGRAIGGRGGARPLAGAAPADRRRRLDRPRPCRGADRGEHARQIEDRWVEQGFPQGEQFERIVRDALAGAT